MDFKSKLTQDSHTLKRSGWSRWNLPGAAQYIMFYNMNKATGAINQWSLDLFLTHFKKEFIVSYSVNSK